MLSTLARNRMLAHLAGLAATASLHTADPGELGGSEISGGEPAYRRQPIGWATPDGGLLRLNAPARFDVPANAHVAHVGFWTAEGLWLGGEQLDADVTFGRQGVYLLDVADVALIAPGGVPAWA